MWVYLYSVTELLIFTELRAQRLFSKLSDCCKNLSKRESYFSDLIFARCAVMDCSCQNNNQFLDDLIVNCDN